MRKVLLAVAPVQTRHRIRITRLVLPYGLGGPGSGGRQREGALAGYRVGAVVSGVSALPRAVPPTGRPEPFGEVLAAPLALPDGTLSAYVVRYDALRRSVAHRAVLALARFASRALRCPATMRRMWASRCAGVIFSQRRRPRLARYSLMSTPG